MTVEVQKEQDKGTLTKGMMDFYADISDRADREGISPSYLATHTLPSRQCSTHIVRSVKRGTGISYRMPSEDKD